MIKESDPILCCDLKAAYSAHAQDIDEALLRVARSGWYVGGAECEHFEQAFAAYVGAAYAVGVASGTDALVLALKALGIGKGDLVFTVSHTAVATVAAIELAGAAPYLVDICADTYAMDPDQLERAIQESRTQGEFKLRAIIPVHLYGHPADMRRICAIAEREGLRVIEDCAQAHGAMIGNSQVGTFGDCGAFSFYPTKNLGALGDAGAVVTGDAALAEEVRILREYGWRERYISSVPGMNSRLDPLQAAVLSAKLKHLDDDTRRRQSLAATYGDALKLCGLVLPVVRDGCSHVYHQYVVRTSRRDALRGHLREQGIQTLVHYPQPVHLQPAYTERLSTARSGLPVTEHIWPSILSLPMYPQWSEHVPERVSQAVRSLGGRDGNREDLRL